MSREKIAVLFHRLPVVVVAALLSLLIEFSVFQFSFWTGLFQHEKNLTWQVVSGGELTEDGTIYVTSKPLQLLTDQLDAEEEVRSVQIKFTQTSVETEEQEPYTTMQLYATDEGDVEAYALSPFRNNLPTEQKSQCFRLHTYGKCKSIRYDIYAEENTVVNIEKLVANPRMSIAFSWLRTLLIFLTILFVYYGFWCREFMYEPICAKKKLHRRATIFVCSLQMVLFLAAAGSNQEFRHVTWPHHKQYHELAQALAKGQLYLEELPPASLNSLENPYDMVARNKLSKATGEEYRWDTAYYNQKYYVYFGVVPVMVFYLPWYLITGTEFPTWLGVAACGVLFIIFAFRLSANISKVYFKDKILYGTWLFTTLLAVNGCGLLTIMRRPDFYSLPIIMAVTLSVAGINFWIASIKDVEAEVPKIVAWKVVAGCLCMALVAGCRPQLVLGSFLVFPIFWKTVFQKRLLFSKKGMVPTILSVLSYLWVALCLMIYNQRRFGSPFDFGANYNLTTNDMTKRGFALARIPVGIFRFLLQLPNISAKFPFLEQTSGWTGYVGTNITEGMFGGFFPVSLLVVASLIILLFKRQWFEKKEAKAIAIMSALFGLGIVCVDVQGAGILLRYMSDFGWLFYIAVLFTWFSAMEHNVKVQDRVICLCMYTNVAFMVGMAFWLLLIFTDGQFSLETTDPKLFYKIYYQLAFWA